MRQAIILISMLLVVATMNSAIVDAQVSVTDFDQDGRSDVVLVQPADSGELDWLSINLTTGLAASLGRLGKTGDHIVLAHWSGQAVPELGVVYYRADSKSIVWEVRGSSGVAIKREFGQKGDLVVSGADFNGNGIADAAVARLVNGRVRWYVSLDLFSDAGAALAQTQIGFGANGARLFYASPDGVNDWIAFTQRIRGRTMMRMRNVLTGEVRSARFPGSLSKEPRPRAFAVKGADGIDVVGFARSLGKNTKLDFFKLDGTPVSSVSLAGNGDIVVGNFDSLPGEEVALKTTNQLSIFSPLTGFAAFHSFPSGIAVDDINVNAVGVDTPVSSPNPGGGSGGGNEVPSGPISSCSSVKAWPPSHIYKTMGSEHFTDVRRNTVGIVIKPGGAGPFPSCIALQDSKGSVHARLGLYGRGDGWEARYYAGIGCGASTPLNGASVAARARSNTGSSSVYANFGSVCYGPIDASRCIGSGQC